MISEGSCDTDDYSKDAENSALLPRYFKISFYFIFTYNKINKELFLNLIIFLNITLFLSNKFSPGEQNRLMINNPKLFNLSVCLHQLQP